MNVAAIAYGVLAFLVFAMFFVLFMNASRSGRPVLWGRVLAVFVPIVSLTVIAIMFTTGTGLFAPKIEVAEPIAQNGTTPVTVQPNAQPSNDGSNNPVAPVQPGTNPVTVNGSVYPALCQPGDTRPQLDVMNDPYAGSYPVAVQIMTANPTEYCINWMPKYSNSGLYDYEEVDVELAFRDESEPDGTGPVDIYFGTNGGLSLWDSKSGLVVYSSSQSTGADQIWALNSITSPFSGSDKPTVNDLVGQTVITSFGGADHFLTLRMAQLIRMTPDQFTIAFPDPNREGSGVMEDFCAGMGQAVAYWDPAVVEASTCQDTELLISTKWWPAITDYVVVSLSADKEMEDAVLYFLKDYNSATQAFTTNNLASTAQLLSTMEFEGSNMASWFGINIDDPTGSFTQIMSGVAIAKLSDNSILFDESVFGASFSKDQLSRAHETWVFGNIPGNLGDALFDVDRFVTDKYVSKLVKLGAQNVNGDFLNVYQTDVNQNPPAPDVNALINLPDWYIMPDSNIQFREGYSNQLISKEEEQRVLEMLESAAIMVKESNDSVFVIRGGMGLFSTDSDQIARNKLFAYRRAQHIQKLLFDYYDVPLSRIIIDENVLLPDHVPSEVVRPDGTREIDEYIVVIISVKNTNYK